MNESNSIVVYNSRLEQMADEALINNSDFFLAFGVASIFFIIYLYLLDNNKYINKYTNRKNRTVVTTIVSFIMALLSTYLLNKMIQIIFF